MISCKILLYSLKYKCFEFDHGLAVIFTDMQRVLWLPVGKLWHRDEFNRHFCQYRSARGAAALRLYSHFPLSLFIVIHLMLRTFCQFYHFANVSKMVGICQLSNGKRTNELIYCFNNHSWALSLIMA